MPDKTYRYRSPLRPIDFGWVGVPDNLDELRGKDWTPQTIYEYRLALPERVVNQWSLEEVQDDA